MTGSGIELSRLAGSRRLAAVCVNGALHLLFHIPISAGAQRRQPEAAGESVRLSLM
jgi:hypothetical protein